MSNPIAEALDNPQPAPQLAHPGDLGPELARHERPPFPPSCPVRPLGISSGIDGSQRCYYLNYNGQLVGLEANNRHGKLGLIALFGPASDWLEANFPQWSKPVREMDPQTKKWVTVKESEIVGFDQAEAARALIEECVRKGIFDPAGRMRGRGAHRLGAGAGLVLHCGDKLLVSDLKADGGIKGWRWIDPGVFERYVYQAAEPIPRPHYEAVHPAAAEKLLRLLFTWQWKRELLDPRFVLGAIGASMLGGALRWRPNVWITGGKGTGKSTLNGKDGVVHQLFGEGVFRTGNASAAGIRQSLKNSTVPVMFDEIEASTNNSRVTEVIELARIASSGDTMTRGSADHTAQEFTLQSCFWFSSINIPPLQPQDRSRLAILELEPFPAGSVPPDFRKINLPEIGRQLARRMVDGWHRLEATKLRFHAALAGVGHDNRACDQFGMLLACADVLLNDHDTADGLPDDEEVNHWAGMCRPQRMAEISESTPDHEACANHIITSMVQARGGDEREMLGSWIGKAVAHAVTPGLAEGIAADRSADRLQQMGLKLVHARYHPETRDAAGKVKPARWGASAFDDAQVPAFLAVAREHQGLARLFEGTLWQQSVWYQSLKRTPGAIENVKIKFKSASLTAVLVPLHAVLDEDDLPAGSRREAAEAWRAAQMQGAEV